MKQAMNNDNVSIYGVSIAQMERFLDSKEVPCYRGKIVIDGVEQGNWSQLGTGTLYDFYSFDTAELERRATAYLFDEGIYEVKPPMAEVEHFLFRLVELKCDEMEYEDAFKKGYDGFACAHTESGTQRWGQTFFVGTEESSGLEAFKSEVQKEAKEPWTMHVYQSAKDFQIVAPKESALRTNKYAREYEMRE